MTKARIGSLEQERRNKNYNKSNISNSTAVGGHLMRLNVNYYTSKTGPWRFIIRVQSLRLNIITLSFQIKIEQGKKIQMKHSYNHSLARKSTEIIVNHPYSAWFPH